MKYFKPASEPLVDNLFLDIKTKRENVCNSNPKYINSKWSDVIIIKDPKKTNIYSKYISKLSSIINVIVNRNNNIINIIKNDFQLLRQSNELCENWYNNNE